MQVMYLSDVPQCARERALAQFKVGDTVALVKELSHATRGKLLDFRVGPSGGK
jgi:hypothetical protein